KVGRNLEKLLALNPRALRLRKAEVKARRSLALAIESGYPPAIAAAEAYLLSVQMRRQVLHLRQQALIETANLWLANGGQKLQRDLKLEWQGHHRTTSSWMQNSIQLKAPDIPSLAV